MDKINIYYSKKSNSIFLIREMQFFIKNDIKLYFYLEDLIDKNLPLKEILNNEFLNDNFNYIEMECLFHKDININAKNNCNIIDSPEKYNDFVDNNDVMNYGDMKMVELSKSIFNLFYDNITLLNDAMRLFYYVN